MNPPEYMPHRTESQNQADGIALHAASIRRGWPHMMPEGPASVRPGNASKSAGITREGDDDAEDESDLDGHTLLMHRRRNAVEVLNSWCRAVMEDRDITNPKSLPLGDDVEGMCAFLERESEWLGWQDYARDCRDELAEIDATVTNYANPYKREWHNLGTCPFIVDEVFCGGKVRIRIGVDEGEATCSGCKQAATVEWWEDVLGTNVETEAVRATALAAILASRLKVTVTERTVRNWARDGRITAVDVFGPQPEGPSYWFSPRTALDEVARMDRECPTCGRVWSGKGDVCVRCYATVHNARPIYAEPRGVMTPIKVRRVLLPDPPKFEGETKVCKMSDLPVAWCGCGRHIAQSRGTLGNEGVLSAPSSRRPAVDNTSSSGAFPVCGGER